MKTSYINVILLALVMLLVSCASGMDSSRTLTPANANYGKNNIPEPNQIIRAGSSVLTVDGNECTEFAGGTTSEDKLILKDLPSGEPEKPAETSLDFAYALYKFDELQGQPLSVEVVTDIDFTTKYWIGFADWANNRWNFKPGSFFSTTTLAMEDFGDPLDFMSPDSSFAVVVVVDDQPAPVQILKVKLTVLDEVESFAATTDRWDGINLDWSYDSKSIGYRMYRRISPDVKWTLLTSEPIERYTVEYTDNVDIGGTDIEYRLTKGIRIVTNQGIKDYWSPGTETIGRRQHNIVGANLGALTSYWPVNIFNLMGFFYQPDDDPNNVNLMYTTSYPPVGEWRNPSESSGEVPDVNLKVLEGWPTPFALYQRYPLNSTSMTVGFTAEDGCYAQVATITGDGVMGWETPVRVRSNDNNVLGFIELTGRIGMITWNTTTSRLEMVGSHDPLGRFWFEFNPDDFPWQIISTRQPINDIKITSISTVPYISFEEKGTGNLVLLKYVGAQTWDDISPPELTAYGGGQFVYASEPLGNSYYGIFHLTDDQDKINYIRRMTTHEWDDASQTLIASANPGNQISEFKVHTREEYSTENFLAYVEEGNLYAMHTTDEGLGAWGDPVLIDDAGSCRNAQIIRIGSDETLLSMHVFLTYIKNDDNGDPRICYRELRQQFGIPHK